MNREMENLRVENLKDVRDLTLEDMTQDGKMETDREMLAVTTFYLNKIKALNPQGVLVSLDDGKSISLVGMGSQDFMRKVVLAITNTFSPDQRRLIMLEILIRNKKDGND